jgi:adenine-specific DNA-methyltransferase
MQKLDGKTKDIVGDNIQQLKQLFPEAFTEDKVDFDMLKSLLGEHIETNDERYSFTWHGKSDAIKIALKQSTGTLRPDKENSKNWDDTENLYIEGDNLEVLRILQSSYRNKIKMIYIDPPYNTGKDFVYSDNFNDTVADYKEKIGEKYKTNANSSGRYHTNWLNMMYPRLKLARNLLTEDGVIFISIDDNEQANLKKLCDEIFGEENFISQLIWENKEGGGSSDSKFFRIKHEYILCYSKNSLVTTLLGEMQEEDSSYAYADEWESTRGRYKLIKLNSFSIQYSKSLDYPIELPNGDVIEPSENGKRGCWRWSKEKYEWGLKNDFIEFKKNTDGKLWVYTKQYFKVDHNNEPTERAVPFRGVVNKYSSTQATKQMESLFEYKAFDYSKPIDLMNFLMTLIPGVEFLTLDFFSGSAATAHATMQLNAEDGGNRKFIMVQLTEEKDEKSEAYKAGYKTIPEIGRERIRRAGEKILEEHKEEIAKRETPLDVGFKAFTLDTTNLTQWDEKTQDVEATLFENIDAVKEGRSQEDVVYEVLLKYGVDISTPIETEELAGKTLYKVAGGYLTICLDEGIDQDFIEKLAEQTPARVVFRDTGFADDTVKINAEMTLKKHGIEDIKVL